MIHLAFIQSFVTVARGGSFRSAASRLFVTQPAISQHIQSLEKNLGIALFERRGRRLFLTPAGHVFLPYAENILKAYNEGKTAAGESLHQSKGIVRIATIYSIGLYELQPVIKKFIRTYPKIDVHLEYHPNNIIYEMVHNHAVDFGLVAYPKKRNGIHFEIFAEDTLVVVESHRRPVFKKKVVTLTQLHGTPCVALLTNTPTQQAINDFLRKSNVRPLIVHEYDNIETLKSALLLGMGYGIVPRNAVVRELKNKSLRMVPVGRFKLKRPLGILYTNGKAFTRSLHLFHETMTQTKII